MKRDSDAVLEAAMSLSETDRARIAERLLWSIGAPESGAEDQVEVDAAWEEEIERRMRAIDEGKVELIPSEEVMAEAWAMVRQIQRRRALQGQTKK